MAPPPRILINFESTRSTFIAIDCISKSIFPVAHPIAAQAMNKFDRAFCKRTKTQINRKTRNEKRKSQSEVCGEYFFGLNSLENCGISQRNYLLQPLEECASGFSSLFFFLFKTIIENAMGKSAKAKQQKTNFFPCRREAPPSPFPFVFLWPAVLN